MVDVRCVCGARCWAIRCWSRRQPPRSGFRVADMEQRSSSVCRPTHLRGYPFRRLGLGLNIAFALSTGMDSVHPFAQCRRPSAFHPLGIHFLRVSLFVYCLLSPAIFLSAMPRHGPRSPMPALRIPHFVPQSMLLCAVRFQFLFFICIFSSPFLQFALLWGPCSSASVGSYLLRPMSVAMRFLGLQSPCGPRPCFQDRLNGHSSACGERHLAFMSSNVGGAVVLLPP